MKQKGQVVLILLLVMTVALAIGLSVVQRSLTDISTSSKIEQSSRAFSAAEAGVERALQGTSPNNFSVDFSEDNNSKANVYDSGLLPNDKQALEYPPISKEEIAHVWLANMDADFKTSTGAYYNQSSLDVYWGLPNIEVEDRPALEVTITYLESNTYKSKKYFYDPVASRASSNGFNTPDGTNFVCSDSLAKINTIFSVDGASDRPFFCKATISGLTPTLILLRARILYSGSSHPFAVVPKGNCSIDPIPCSLPKQAKIIRSMGLSGDSQRFVQLFQIKKVVPFFFDYAIFSAGLIDK